MKINIESVEFWKNVLEDYKGSRVTFICGASTLFRAAWDKKMIKYEIRALANEFLKSKRSYKDRVNAKSVVTLFQIVIADAAYLHSGHAVDERLLRFAFIRWVIKKFEVKG